MAKTLDEMSRVILQCIQGIQKEQFTVCMTVTLSKINQHVLLTHFFLFICVSIDGENPYVGKISN